MRPRSGEADSAAATSLPALGHSVTEASGSSAWRRNLWVICGSTSGVMLVYAVISPFIPLYLKNELGVHDPAALALWTGVFASSGPTVGVIATPIWGALADRYGRKPMVIRATAWGGLVYIATALVQSAPQLVGARVLYGLGSGVESATTAFLVAETPPKQVPRALGMLSSSRALGLALGPAVGGIGATYLRLRLVFVIAGVLQLVLSAVVALFTREKRAARTASRPTSIWRILSEGPVGKRTAIYALLAGLGFTQFAFACAQQIVVLRMIGFSPPRVALYTGGAFSCLSLATVGAAIAYPRLLQPLGFRRVVYLAAAVTASALALAALMTAPAGLIGAAALFGAGYGLLYPSLTSMIGLEAPASAKGSTFGLSSSVVVAAAAVGPLCGGVVTAAAGTGAGLLMGAVAAALAGIVVAARGREPVVE